VQQLGRPHPLQNRTYIVLNCIRIIYKTFLDELQELNSFVFETYIFVIFEAITEKIKNCKNKNGRE
jgi:hypothetical protein